MYDVKVGSFSISIQSCLFGSASTPLSPSKMKCLCGLGPNFLVLTRSYGALDTKDVKRL